MQLKVIISLLLWTSLNACLFCQSQDWKKETTKDGTITVWSQFTTRDNESGKDVQVLKYRCFTTTGIARSKLVATFRNTVNHKNFMQYTEVCRELSRASPNEWLVYYAIDTPWPLPDSDCVTLFQLTESADQKATVIKGTARPTAYARQGVKRMEYNDTKYTFKELGKETYVEIEAAFTPVTNAPKWLIKGWFPEGPGNLLKKLIKTASYDTP